MFIKFKVLFWFRCKFDCDCSFLIGGARSRVCSGDLWPTQCVSSPTGALRGAVAVNPKLLTCYKLSQETWSSAGSRHSSRPGKNYDLSYWRLQKKPSSFSRKLSCVIPTFFPMCKSLLPVQQQLTFRWISFPNLFHRLQVHRFNLAWVAICNESFSFIFFPLLNTQLFEKSYQDM